MSANVAPADAWGSVDAARDLQGRRGGGGRSWFTRPKAGGYRTMPRIPGRYRDKGWTIAASGGAHDGKWITTPNGPAGRKPNRG
jgi:hypothetical protein